MCEGKEESDTFHCTGKLFHSRVMPRSYISTGSEFSNMAAAFQPSLYFIDESGRVAFFQTGFPSEVYSSNMVNGALGSTANTPLTLSQSHADGSVTGWESDFRPLDRPVVAGDLVFVNLDIGMDVWDTWNGEEDVFDDEAGYVPPVFSAHSGMVVWAPSNGVMPGGFVDITWNDCPEPWRSRTFKVDTSMWRFDSGSRYWIWDTDLEPRNFSDTNSEASLVDNSSPPWG